METLALILAGGKGSRLDILSQQRAKPSVPFAGKYRIIDFSLSNCVNSGIYQVGVLTQYMPFSLNDHIGVGGPWTLDRRSGSVTLLHPCTGKLGEGDWYEGTAHAVQQNIDFIEAQDPDNVIILSGDHVYKMDYNKLITYHQQQGADLTIAAQPVPKEEASRFGILDVDEELKIMDFQEKPDDPPSNLASMGIYVFDKEVLIEKLKKHCSPESSDFGHHIIPVTIDDCDSFAYEFTDYWRDVGTVKSFWEANLDLISSSTKLNLNDQNWKIYTRSEERPFVKFGPQGRVRQSIVVNGATIHGEVKNSIISPGVVIEEGAIVKDSIIFDDTVIKENSIIDKCIVDKEVTVGANVHLGFGDDLTVNLEKPKLLSSGLNIIGKGASIPSNTRIGRNCRIFPGVNRSDFKERIVLSGSTVKVQTGGLANHIYNSESQRQVK
ncbi:glucose-1-phosphate adenylyltransferase [Fuchsiella alkaliacetigena]|uniref:glucose-1-phosphate adenylyltransferase n=1 Tax=Fuchsiella alkaliacetigena TaxID=957042 RepID=UPI00200ACC72|nr:glucose-1-phosphate adenylyltransferase [Fuchsiella alkaliacetigena]MCK8825431.1 glucose-1-phosphate adenylyltransferase [Fuchsiella alkaliacetigena]